MAGGEGPRQGDGAGGRFARRRARHRSTMELVVDISYAFIDPRVRYQ
jgi:hypothetical protein